MNIYRNGRLGSALVATIILMVSTPAFSAEPDLTGKWAGRTQCPLGVVDLQLEISGKAAEISHSGYGRTKQNPASFPLGMRYSTGHEGEWIYFDHATDPYRSWGSFSGLISADASSILVRDRSGLGDCRPFQFSRVKAVPPPAVGAACPEKAREPTEDEMRSAVEAVRNLDIAVGTAAHNARIQQFTKIACEKAVGMPGYNCDYSAYIEYRTNDESSQMVFDIIRKAHGDTGPSAATGRFVCSGGNWKALDIR